MKNKIIYVFLILVMTVVSCKKDFTVRSTLTGSSLDNFYNTADEVRASTSTLYSGLPWAGFMSRGLDDIGDECQATRIHMKETVITGPLLYSRNRQQHLLCLIVGRPTIKSVDGQQPT